MQATLWLSTRWSNSCRVPAWRQQQHGAHRSRSLVHVQAGQWDTRDTSKRLSGGGTTRRELMGMGLLLSVLHSRDAIAGENSDPKDASSPTVAAPPKTAPTNASPPAPQAGSPPPSATTTTVPSNPILNDSNGKPAERLSDEEAKALLDEEEARRRGRRRNKGRLQELQEIRAELAEREAELLEKEKELLEKEQTVAVLREELEIEKRLRVLLSKEKERAAEEASLAMGLCGPLGL